MSGEFRQEMERDIDNLSSLTTNLVESQNQLEISKTALTRNIDEIAVKVNSRRNKLKGLVDKDADALLRELEAIKNQRLEEIDAKREDVETRLLTIDGNKLYSTQMSAAGSDADVCVQVNDLHNRAEELREKNSISSEDASMLGVSSCKEIHFIEGLETGENIIGKLNGTGNSSCDHRLQFHSTLQYPAIADDENYHIAGIAILQDDLFVMGKSGFIVVYDVQMFQFKRRFRLDGFKEAMDMKQCHKQNCLYAVVRLSEDKNQNEIIKFDPMGNIKKRWSVKGHGRFTLSITQESNVLVTVLQEEVCTMDENSTTYRYESKNQLQEYTSDGQQIHTIIISYGIPHHAIKLNSCTYAVSVENWRTIDRIYIFDPEGKCLKYHDCRWNERQIYRPCYMDIDENGNFLVAAGQWYSSVLILSSHFEPILEIPISSDSSFDEEPQRILYYQRSSRVFVVTSKREKHSITRYADEVKIFTLEQLNCQRN